MVMSNVLIFDEPMRHVDEVEGSVFGVAWHDGLGDVRLHWLPVACIHLSPIDSVDES
jgi:hypothetical protein